MKVNVTLSLTAAENKQLAGILGCATDDLPSRLEAYLSAASEEYVRMFLGQRVFTRGSDIREYRLLLLMKHAFPRSIPDQRTISSLFQTTGPQSRSLTSAVLSKYQYELTDSVREALKQILRSISPAEDGDGYHVVIDNEHIIEVLNRELQAEDGTLPSVRRVAGTVSTYALAESAKRSLATRLGLKS